MKCDIKSLDLIEIREKLSEWDIEPYRASQLLMWLYGQRVDSWDRMSNIPAKMLKRLREEYDLYASKMVDRRGSADSTNKFLWELKDGNLIESVLIPASHGMYGDWSDRHTLCVSSQVGCAYGCKFCASGLDGIKRNLEVDEIVEQVVAVERWYGQLVKGLNKKQGVDPSELSEDERLVAAMLNRSGGRRNKKASKSLIDNVVMMGMGEPLANYDNLIGALFILNAQWGCEIGARKITVSTCGLAPEIRELADEDLQVRLAVSLHGATDDVREEIMPVNKKYPLEDLIDALEYYNDRHKQMITLEYILIEGVNEGLEHIASLTHLCHILDAKINLIPYNTVEGLPWKRPSDETIDDFHEALKDNNVNVTLRREKGHDISAACGQLRLQTQKAMAGLGAVEEPASRE